MFLLFRLGRLDVMPAGDMAVQEGLARLDGLEERPTPKELMERGRGVAAAAQRGELGALAAVQPLARPSPTYS